MQRLSAKGRLCLLPEAGAEKNTAGKLKEMLRISLVHSFHRNISAWVLQETEKEKQEQISNRLIREFTAWNVHPSSDSLLLYAVWFLDSKLCTLSISSEYAVLMNTEALNILYWLGNMPTCTAWCPSLTSSAPPPAEQTYSAEPCWDPVLSAADAGLNPDGPAAEHTHTHTHHIYWHRDNTSVYASSGELAVT